MSDTIRFPLVASGPAGPAETSQIISFGAPQTSFPQGGPNLYADVRAWKLEQYVTESPYCAVVIEFTAATGGFTLGNGTSDLIGLFGLIGDITASTSAQKYLLGILGYGLGNKLPQLPFITDPDGVGVIGVAQVVKLVSLYDALAIGGVTGAITWAGNVPVSITARPVRRRDFGG